MKPEIVYIHRVPLTPRSKRTGTVKVTVPKGRKDIAEAVVEFINKNFKDEKQRNENNDGLKSGSVNVPECSDSVSYFSADGVVPG